MDENKVSMLQVYRLKDTMLVFTIQIKTSYATIKEGIISIYDRDNSDLIFCGHSDLFYLTAV